MFVFSKTSIACLDGMSDITLRQKYKFIVGTNNPIFFMYLCFRFWILYRAKQDGPVVLVSRSV